jgi:hypothetical protein
MNWWEWVFSGVGVSAALLVIQWWTRRSRSSGHDAAITAQGARVSDSPVASGSDIVQTVTHNYYPPAVPPSPAVSSATKSEPKPKHNIKVIEPKSIEAHSGLKDGKIHESQQGLGDFHVCVVCFRNEPIVGKRVQEPTLKSHIIYKDKNGEEITDVPRGLWLGELGETTVFESGKKKCLIIFLLSKQNTLKKLWNEEYHSETSWMAGGPVFQIRDEGIRGDVTLVEVRLLAHDICVLSADFDVRSRIDGGLPKLILRKLSVA